MFVVGQLHVAVDQRIGGDTTIFQAGGVKVSVLVAVSGSVPIVPLSELPVGVGVGDRVGATGELSFGDGPIGTSRIVGGASNGYITLGSVAVAGRCFHGGPLLLSTFCAFDNF